MLRFVNSVAADIEKEFPDVAISTLAYQYTRKPPKHAKPGHNVIVRLCSIECSFSKPLIDKRNQAFQNDILGWSKICDRLYIWDYVINFRHYFLPHPNLRVLGANVKFFVKHRVKGIFEEAARNNAGTEMAELRGWVLAKLMWEPSLDSGKLIDEFLEGYYGPASPYIKEYLRVTHNAVAASGDWLGCFTPHKTETDYKSGSWLGQHTAEFLSFDTLNEGWGHLKAAERAVKDEPELRFRVQVAQLPMLYVFIMRWDEMREKVAAGVDWPMPESIETAYSQFMKVAKKKNITRLDPWHKGFAALEEAVKQAKK
jgi:hypothetical protein